MHKTAGDLIGYTYEGHAGYAEYGFDIVCAAVTAQLMMTYNGLELVAEVALDMKMDPQGGFFSFRLKDPAEENRVKAKMLMETLKLGLMAISEQYEENITLEEEEV